MIPTATVVHVAIELSTTSWLVGTRLPGAEKSRMHRLSAGDVAGLLALVAGLHAQAATKMGQPATEPPRVSRRPLGLGQAAKACTSA